MTATDAEALPPVAVMWENFGPTHHDRLRALAKAGFETHAIELFAISSSYQWEREESAGYRVYTLAPDEKSSAGLAMFWRFYRTCIGTRARHVFLCHYQSPMVLAVATALRLSGRRVYAMCESKFDDYPRFLWREVGKSIFLMPYNGALAASRRTFDYIRFLGMASRPIEYGYAMIDTERIRSVGSASDCELAYEDRPFLIVARLVPKKNIAGALEAFAEYRERHRDPRELHIVGYGPLREELEGTAERLGLGNTVKFLGPMQAAEVANAMTGALALVLVSTEEQSGLVINEALASGLPVIVSRNAGAVDVLVENLGNGIVVDPDDRESIVLAMAYLGLNETNWKSMRLRARETSARGDAGRFVEGVRRLVARQK